MKELKCSHCGSTLVIDENKEYAKCDYCGSKYKLKDDLNVNINLDDTMKEVINTGLGAFKNTSRFMVVPIILFVIFFIAIVMFGIFSSIDSKNEFDVHRNKIEESIKSQQDSALKERFNFQFSGDNGTKNAIFLRDTLDTIVESNKTNDRIVTLVFDGKETTDEKEIIDIKHSLDGDYEVSFTYDDGYISKIVVDKI